MGKLIAVLGDASVSTRRRRDTLQSVSRIMQGFDVHMLPKLAMSEWIDLFTYTPVRPWCTFLTMHGYPQGLP